jgi:hypothetical protein
MIQLNAVLTEDKLLEKKNCERRIFGGMMAPHATRQRA